MVLPPVDKNNAKRLSPQSWSFRKGKHQIYCKHCNFYTCFYLLTNVDYRCIMSRGSVAFNVVFSLLVTSCNTTSSPGPGRPAGGAREALAALCSFSPKCKCVFFSNKHVITSKIKLERNLERKCLKLINKKLKRVIEIKVKKNLTLKIKKGNK